MSKDYQPTICVDFNGVLDMYTGWRPDFMYPPRQGAHEFLWRLNEEGFRVVIFTTLPSEVVGEWLDRHNFDRRWIADVTSVKPPAVAYVDARAVCFRGDFDATLTEVLTFHAHWEAQHDA